MSWGERVRHLFLPHHTNNFRARLLHPLPKLLLLVGVLGFQLVLSGASFQWPQVLGYAARIPADKVVELTNKVRLERGLPSLQLNSQLSQAALAKAADMFAKDYWAHVAPDGTEPWKFITDSGYVYVFAGENLARDFANPEAVVEAWMASPTHRDNLLSSRYQEMGVAVVDGQLAGLETTLVVQMFGAQAGSLGVGEIAAQSVVEPSQTRPVPVEAGEEAVVAPNQYGSGQAPVGVPEPVWMEQRAVEKGEPYIGIAQTDYRPMASPFDVSRAGAMAVLGMLFLVLVLDAAIVSQRRLVRIAGRTWAHMAFYAVLILAIWIMKAGQIL